MKNRIVLVMIVIMSFFSCKNEGDSKVVEQNAANPKEEKADENLLKVSFDLIVKEDDNMHLYYTEDGTIDFDEKKSIWMSVTGNDQAQEVTFKLPENVLPTHLRVDFGHGKNETQSDVDLKSFRLQYYDKTFEAKDTMIFNYFYPNLENTVVPNKTAILKRKAKDQPGGPILYPHEPLTIELQKLVQ